MTERLYYTDSYTQEFSSTVTANLLWQGRPAVKLASTCFYPDSGGQPADRGFLNETPVIAVVEENDAIVHVLEDERPQKEDEIIGRIDWERRFDHMQQHTGQHILSQAFLRELDGNTESFHLGSSCSTIDLSLDELTKEEIYRAEDAANQIIFEDRSVRIHFVDPGDQTDLPLRTESERAGEVRIIEIEDFDFSPCGGTHCNRTGEVGLIKILRWERVRRRARVEFLCGWRALRDYRWKHRAMYQLSRVYSAADSEVVSMVEKQIDRERNLRQELRAMETRLLNMESKQIMERSVIRNRTKIAMNVWQECDLKTLNKTATLILGAGQEWIVLFGTRNPKPALLFARSEGLREYDMRDWISQVAPLINGRGGGTSERAQAGGTSNERLEEALEEALRLLER